MEISDPSLERLIPLLPVMKSIASSKRKSVLRKGQAMHHPSKSAALKTSQDRLNALVEIGILLSCLPSVITTG